MILTADINKVVRAALIGQSVFASGGAWPNLGPDNPASYPYVVFKIAVGDTLYDSGPKYHQYWRVRAAAYCQLGETPAPLDIMKALHAALVVGYPAGAVVTTLRNEGEAVLHSLLKTSEEEFDETLRDGADVLVASLECELLCLGLNSVA